ncbi:MAG: xanthine dehydrogenase small subunit [Proteobacteria bacterium]|nr:MAG: xanthine dehydrogenase small subunit [Pseudomonadota bacterium]
MPPTEAVEVTASSKQRVRFILDGAIIEIDDCEPTMTLLEYLRERLGRTGTKEGCAEGDCGACTVVLGELAGDAIRYSAINSCIRFLPTVDGKEVVTVESLKRRGGPLHPVQQALVDCHGSQCGFCTPGFVMSLFALYLERAEADRSAVTRALAGNLCRCTGYRPIIDAGCRMHEYPAPDLWSRSEAQSAPRLARLRSIQRSTTLSLAGFQAPRSADELARLCQANPQAVLLAGGTDVGLWVTKQLRTLPELIYLGDVADLNYVRERRDTLEIGAAASLTNAYAAIVAHYPMLQEVADRFGSPPVRNSGTFCGNVANGSPIGDSMPFMIALGASVLVRYGDFRRELPLEYFYLGYQKKALEPGGFVESVQLPLPRPGHYFATYKVSKRIDQDISAVCGAYAIQVADGRIVAARVAYGGMAAVPQRAQHTEVALIGRSWTRETIQAALPALADDYAPITDMRASREYRQTVAQNLLLRFFLEHQPSPGPVRIPQPS